jgi:hypothetical protein
MVPLPSVSTSFIMSCISASVGFWPRERITVASSLVVMLPAKTKPILNKWIERSQVLYFSGWMGDVNTD